jgi:hypothetical protein
MSHKTIRGQKTEDRGPVFVWMKRDFTAAGRMQIPENREQVRPLKHKKPPAASLQTAGGSKEKGKRSL